jgi:hypothetical protein
VEVVHGPPRPRIDRPSRPLAGSVCGLPAMNRPAQASPDRLVVALARYIEALDRRYPEGPPQLRSELDARAKVSVMPTDRKREPAA